MSQSGSSENITLEDVSILLQLKSRPNYSIHYQIVDLLKDYVKKPLHEITLELLEEKKHHFPLYLYFLRLSEAKVSVLTDEADALIARMRRLNPATLGRSDESQVRSGSADLSRRTPQSAVYVHESLGDNGC
jgi:hypothetical protein